MTGEALAMNHPFVAFAWIRLMRTRNGWYEAYGKDDIDLYNEHKPVRFL